MDDLRKNEIFEIEALEILKGGMLLDPLVFGGGTMLRLCFELNRYSTDLDFWFIKAMDHEAYFKKAKKYLEKHYELTDAAMKFYTILFEMRKSGYPKRLKIEIRKEERCHYEDRIAFSRYTTKQVLVRVLTLDEAMRRKILAALDRKDARDFFDIEFLLRHGVDFGADRNKIEALKEAVSGLRAGDYKVTLGSLLAPDDRKYYSEHGFSYLAQKIESLLSKDS